MKRRSALCNQVLKFCDAGENSPHLRLAKPRRRRYGNVIHNGVWFGRGLSVARYEVLYNSEEHKCRNTNDAETDEDLLSRSCALHGSLARRGLQIRHIDKYRTLDDSARSVGKSCEETAKTRETMKERFYWGVVRQTL